MSPVIQIGLLVVSTLLLQQANACGFYQDIYCDRLCGPNTCNKPDPYPSFCLKVCGPGIQEPPRPPKPVCLPPAKAVWSFFSSKWKCSTGHLKPPVCRPPARPVRKPNGEWECVLRDGPFGRSLKTGGGFRSGGIDKPDCPPGTYATADGEGGYYCQSVLRSGRKGRPTCLPPSYLVSIGDGFTKCVSGLKGGSRPVCKPPNYPVSIGDGFIKCVSGLKGGKRPVCLPPSYPVSIGDGFIKCVSGLKG